MISDLSQMIEAVDAVTDRTSVTDLVALERDLADLTPEQRAALGQELAQTGTATLRAKGRSFRLQIKHRPTVRAI
jgi:hypothetical protein